MTSVMTAPDFSVDPNRDLIRRIIEARTAYERLCGVAPTCIHVGPAMWEALAGRGMRAEVAGLKIIASPPWAQDVALCSRDENMFAVVVAAPEKRYESVTYGMARTAATEGDLYESITGHRSKALDKTTKAARKKAK
jgi:hypothetical protein